MGAGDDRAQLPEAIRALLDPAAYPEPPTSIRLVQTQISFVVVAGDDVYKVKKPVNLGFLDYSTLAKRRQLSQREVELNRRLCPQTYLGVVPLVKAHGRVVYEIPKGEGEYQVGVEFLRMATGDLTLLQALFEGGSETAEG